MPIFLELSLVLLCATILSFVLRLMKQPLVIGYILTGVIVGPSLLNLIEAYETLEIFSQFGIAMLLFIVGLHLSPRIIKEVGSVSTVTGVGQVLFTSVIGFGISLLLGFSTIEAAYVSIALTFSSTIIVLKLLADRGDIQTLYGKISIGFLLVQDIIAALILIVVSAMASSNGANFSSIITDTLLKGVGLLLLLIVFGKYILPKLAQFASRNTELLFLFSLTWGLIIASLFAFVGFSIEIGALAAGVALSSSDFADEISSRLRPLRDFFVILFFILLGSKLVISASLTLLLPAVILSLFVLIGNPIIVLILMNLLGYHRRTGFMAGLTVAQISEFSLILASLGGKLGHVTEQTLTIITLVGLFTIAGSTYLILYADQIYAKLDPYLRFLEFRKKTSKKRTHQDSYDIFLFGYLDAGGQFLPLFERSDYSSAIVDFDPDVISSLKEKGINHFYGDAGNIEFLQELPLEHAKLTILSITDMEVNSLIVKHLKATNPKIIILVFANSPQDALKLYDAGATYVVWSHRVGVNHLQRLISKLGFQHSAFSLRRERELRRLQEYLYSN
ncbi:MAG: sodium:proton exchanger [Candidatus Pacebacteria bacterium CG_4_10_14_0_8_um_filter_42_14]|nr:MAG: sodium:proton exchanger [Candidatus Pacebacteria bacterium CG_4_10_14_0_8_um_filter_42_14]